MRFSRPLVLIAALSAGMFAQSAWAEQAEADINLPSSRHSVPRVAQELNLNAEQRVEFKAIVERERAAVKAIQADTTLAPEQRRAKIQSVKKEIAIERDKLLTPEQRARLKAGRQEHQAGRRERRERPMDPNGPPR